MSDRPPFRIHVVALAAAAAVAGLLAALYFVRPIVALVQDHHEVFVIAFLGLFVLWCYWVVVALIKRRISDSP